ncbi:MAG: beta-propeller fold lactonase family protein [Longicatena sp.]
MSTYKGYIASYSEGNKQGIYEYEINEKGILSNVHLLFPLQQAKYLSYRDKCLVSSVEVNNQSGVVLFCGEQMKKEMLLPEKSTSCYITQDKNKIYSANYHEGSVTIYAKINNVLSYVKELHVKEKAGCHQIILYKNYFLVPCLLLDRILVFDATSYKQVKSIHFPIGSGPRHGVFNQSQKILYVVSELSNEVFKYQVNNLEFTLIERLSLLHKEQCGESAGIALSQDERFLYISIRTLDQMVVLSLENEMKIIQMRSCGGRHPRHFTLVEKQHCLLVANRYSNNIVSIEINPNDGLLGNIVSECFVQEPLCVIESNEDTYE